MKTLKILFAAFLLTSFVGVTQTKAQAVAEWFDHKVSFVGCDNSKVKVDVTKHRVTTANGIINFVAFGSINGIANLECLIPDGKKPNKVDGWADGTVITIYPDGTFKAVRHFKGKKEMPAGKN